MARAIFCTDRSILALVMALGAYAQAATLKKIDELKECG